MLSVSHNRRETNMGHGNRRWSAAVITLAAAGIVPVTIIATNLADDPAADYRNIAALLVQRGSNSEQGVVAYRNYRFLTSPGSFGRLAELLASSQVVAPGDLTEQVQRWVDSNLPPEREAWSGVCAFRPDQWQDRKVRIAGVDTTRATLNALAAAAGVGAGQLPRQVVTYSDGVIEREVEDGLTLLKRPVTGRVHPLMPLDVSLAPWQLAIDLGANVPGQRIYAATAGDLQTIRYVNSLAEGARLTTDYTFSASLDWAPTSIRSYDDEGTLSRTIFGYQSGASAALVRPRAVAKGVIQDTGEVKVSVWIVDDWQESCDAARVEFREPALYMELDYTGGGEPVAALHYPPYTTGGCGSNATAYARVIESLGTDDPATDFTYDGIVDEDDIKAVFERFP
jgi:hypothetical protein